MAPPGGHSHPPQEPSRLVEALERCRVALPMATNIGRTGDDHDVYALLDEVTAGVREAMPQSLCHRGCDACCQYPEAFFNVHEDEWNLIVQHIETLWSEERQREFLAGFHASVAKLRRRLRLAQFLLDQPLPLRPLPPTFLRRCPFLLDGSCSIYPVRPWKCRAFGWFSYRKYTTRKLAIYSCREQALALSSPGPEPRASLPSATPFHSHLWRMLSAKAQSLPVWILETWSIRRPARADENARRSGARTGQP